MIDIDIVKKAYKKLKSNSYHDKTMPLLRHSIVNFECRYDDNDFDDVLQGIYKWLLDACLFKNKTKEILKKIDVISLPKSFNNNCKENVISNSDVYENNVKELQYYIDMPVEGHILGVLWIMLIGCHLDKKLGKNIYGNRISKYLMPNKDIGYTKDYSYSPYLFEPYFVQYESWRDKGLDCAKKIVDNKKNVVIITLDMHRYFYSLDINIGVMNNLLKEIPSANVNEEDKNIYALLNDFVGSVIEIYSKKFDDEFEKRNILPIGFLPSNIISNWCLKNFDEAILNGWNPAYYGRYVDDILIVDSVDDDSALGQRASKGDISKDELIDLFFSNCTKWTKEKNDRLFCDDFFGVVKSRRDKDNNIIYTVNSLYYYGNSKTVLEFNLEKTRLFYFNFQESTALIDCFKKQIMKNKSEFRHMPDVEVFKKDDYTDIYDLVNDESLNKFRGIKEFDIDKFELSKFLGKYLKICALVDNEGISQFEEDILRIFNSHTVLNNYGLWEKLVEIFIIKEKYYKLEQLCGKIIKAINGVKYVSDKSVFESKDVKKRLYEILYISLCRGFSLVWKQKRYSTQMKIYETYFKSKEGKVFKKIDEIILGYLKTKMFDKSVMPIPFFLFDLKDLYCNNNINLTRLSDLLPLINEYELCSYKYFPYLISLFDLSIIRNLNFIKKYENGTYFGEDDINDQYYFLNYNNHRPLSKGNVFFRNKKNIDYVSVGANKKGSLKIAIANITLKQNDFNRALLEMGNHSYTRYKDLSHIVNEAIESKTDLLVMPESYVPYGWLPMLAQMCKKEQIAIVTGIEHFKCGNTIWNFTAVILPYEKNGHKDAYIHFHLKCYYAPSEVKSIEGYGLSYKEGKSYELYKWNDCYFSVYCCYELTSITNRAIFQSLADMIVAVEWNPDIKYYSNIAESLSRDIHCYFIQVNSADYGDSRIVKPTRSVEKDLIRTKGGINSSVLVDEIDIKSLREFQIKQYILQKEDRCFKVTPPNFDRSVVKQKIRGEEISFKERYEDDETQVHFIKIP